jgi:hypothetical protein
MKFRSVRLAQRRHFAHPVLQTMTALVKGGDIFYGEEKRHGLCKCR